jgi:DNA-directed RNA polymerase specialized sigma24 family protein
MDSAASLTTPAASFDALYRASAARLTQQTYLLTGQRHRAAHCVRRAFQLAWTHWDEVSTDLSPEGWVRTTAFDLALSPWRPTLVHTAAHHGKELSDDDRALLGALRKLPGAQRRALVLHDAIGLDWRQTAAEIESSTPAAYGRVVRARLALARLAPTAAGPDARAHGFGRRLGARLRHAAVRGCPQDTCPVAPPWRVQLRGRLHERGVTTAAGALSLAVAGGMVAALVWGVPWRAPESARVVVAAEHRGVGVPAPAVAPVTPAAMPRPLLADFPSDLLTARPAEPQTWRGPRPPSPLCALLALPCGHRHAA